MIRFEDIKVHDLVFIDAGEDYTAGWWYIVTGVSKRCSFITAAPLGDADHSMYIPEEDTGLILKHIRMAAVPGAIEAHEHIQEYWNGDQNETAMADALNHIVDTSSDALRAVRGEESE